MQPYRVAHKALTPIRPRLVETEWEIRFDVPLPLIFDNLAYIGIVMFETWYVYPHYHEHFELCYVAEGQGWFAIDSYSYKVKQGDLFLTKPGEVHQGGAAGDAPFRLYYTGFQLSQLNNLERDYYAIGIQRVVNEQAASVQPLFENIMQELEHKQSHCLEMVHSLFVGMLVRVLRHYEQVARRDGETPILLSPLLREILYLIHNEVGNAPTIAELAARVHISRSHLAREFKRSIGVSLGSYIRLLCLERARQLLRESNESVSSIAICLHFPSIHTFSIFFKRHTGFAPQEYRKRTRA